MTKEEAIQILADLIDSPFLHTWEKQNKALHMAIEALHREEAEEKGYCHRIIPSNVEVVVRCKDCRFNKHPLNDLCLIKKAGIYPDDDDFCSYGEKEKK